MFANCAKNVATDAKVNVVMSDKVLVKHLQREIARLENELKFPGSTSCNNHAAALREKDELIKQVLLLSTSPLLFVSASMTFVLLYSLFISNNVCCSANEKKKNCYGLSAGRTVEGIDGAERDRSVST